MAIKNLRKVDYTRDEFGKTARDLAKRFTVYVLKSDNQTVGCVTEVLEDLNGKAVPVGYTDECCYLLLTQSKTGEYNNIADPEDIIQIHDLTNAEDAVDMRFISQFEQFLPIAFFNEDNEIQISEYFNFIIDSKRFGGLVSSALKRVRATVGGADDWRVDVDLPEIDYEV